MPAFTQVKQHGFTLLELMIVLAIAGILVAMAAPSFDAMIKTNRIDTYRNNWVNAFKVARSEAVHTQSPVTICASSDQSTCSGTWDDGWIIFIDLDSSNQRSVGSERLIDVAYGNNAIRTISTPTSTSELFEASGMRNNVSVTFQVCDVNTSSGIVGKALTVSRIGAISFTPATGC